MVKLHEVLSLRRKTIRMSFEELSNKSGISISTLNKIFTGITANPAYEAVRNIAHAMGITTDDVANMMDEKTERKLSQSSLDFARKYEALDEWGKRAIDAIMDIETRRCQQDIEALLDEAEEAETRRRKVTG